MFSNRRRYTHSRRTTLVLSAALAFALPLAGPGAASAAECANADAHPSDVSLGTIRAATLCLVNDERTSRGLEPLRSNSKLQESATRHSRQMDRYNFFSHPSRNGDSPTDRIRKTGYLKGASTWFTGENMAWGAYDYATPRVRVRAWMNSSDHREHILAKRFRDIGIGVVRGAPVPDMDRGATYTTDFGRN